MSSLQHHIFEEAVRNEGIPLRGTKKVLKGSYFTNRDKL
jgi:hypothetical protein